ncbi:MAG: hypothetical protein ABIT05_13070 [Chitinophagaceae bacterium]
MSTRLMIDDQNQLQEVRDKKFPQPPAVRTAATFISYLFHPVFVPLYIILFMVYGHPYFFAGISRWDKTRIVMMAVLMFTFFPLITVLLLKALDFINSVYLHTKKDRIIPLIACGVWYFWITYIWWNSNKMDDQLSLPKEAVQLALATFISSWLALMINIKMKVSLHAISMGVLVAFMLSMGLTQPLHLGIYISLAFLIAGLVCSSRFIVSDHTQEEVYGGFIAGALSVLVAGWLIYRVF